MLIRAVVKTAKGEGLPLLSLGSCFSAETLLLVPPGLGGSWVAAVPGLIPPSVILAWTQTHWLGFLAWPQTSLVAELGDCWAAYAPGHFLWG